MTQITVLSGVERRRHWSDEGKLALMEASLPATVLVSLLLRIIDENLALVNELGGTGFVGIEPDRDHRAGENHARIDDRARVERRGTDGMAAVERVKAFHA